MSDSDEHSGPVNHGSRGNSFKKRNSANGSKRGVQTGEISSLSGSMRKRAPLNKQYITVQKEDGDIGHLEVNVNDETFTTQQPILQSLAELGEIPPSPNLQKPGFKALEVGNHTFLLAYFDRFSKDLVGRENLIMLEFFDRF